MATETLTVQIVGKDMLSGPLGRLGKGFGTIGKIAGGAALAGVTALAAGITAFGVSAVKEGASFTKAMSNVKAISGATASEFAKLEEQAKQLGSTTKFTAIEAAEGMSFLAMAGFEVNDIMGAMPGVLNLASASNMDLGRSADIVSNILSGFGADASQTEHFVDVLTKTFTESNTSLEQLGQAFKFVAPIAESFGFSVEETAAALGTLGDAGIQSGIAGRGLRGVMSKLGAPTEAATNAMKALGISVFDGEGAMKSFPEIIGDFNKALQGMTEKEKAAALGAIFSRGELSNMLVLMKAGQGTLTDFGKELENSGGTAAAIAAEQLNNLSGDVTLFQSALSGVKIEVFEALEPLLRKAVQSGTQFLTDFGPKISDAFAMIADTVTTAIDKVGSIITLFKAFGATGAAMGLLAMLGFGPDAINAFSEISEKIKADLGALFGLIATGETSFSWVDIITGALVFINENFDVLRNIILGIGAALAVAGIVGAFLAIIAAINPVTIAIAAIGAAVGMLALMWTENWGNIQAIAMTAWVVLQAIFAAFMMIINEQVVPNIMSAFASLTESLASVGISWSDVWNAIIAAIQIVAAVIGASILLIIGVIVGLIAAVSKTVGVVIKIFTGLASGLTNIIAGIMAIFVGLITFLSGDFTAGWEIMSAGVEAIVDGFATIILSLIEGLTVGVISVIAEFIRAVIGFFQNLYNELVGNSIVTDLVNTIIELFKGLVESVLSTVSGWVTDLLDYFGDMVDDGLEFINDFIDSIVEIFEGLHGMVDDALESDSFESLGKKIIDGIKKGIKNGIGALKQAIKEAAKKALDAAKDALGITSPSKRFMEIGELSGEGMVKGLESIIPKIQSAAGGLGQLAIDSAMLEMDRGNTFNTIDQSVNDNSMNLTINSLADNEDIIQTFEAMRAMVSNYG